MSEELEARARAVAYWEQNVRPEIARKEAAGPKEAPHQALDRLKTEAAQPVVIGSELAKKLADMRQELGIEARQAA